jgi:phospholipid/cholesterol/gamma-HCH transport system substrate-binding protein
LKISNEVKFGIVAVVSIALAALGISYMQGTRLLGNSLTLHAKYENVSGLIRGNPVIIKGVNVGQVMEIDYQDTVVVVEIELKKKWEIPSDSYAEIFANDLLGVGGKSLRIVKGTSEQLLDDDDFITGKLEQGIFDQVGATAEESLGSLLPNIEKATARLASLAGNLDTAVTSVMERDELASILKNVDQSMASLNKITAELSKAMPKLTALSTTLAENDQNISASLDNVKQLTDSLAASSADLKATAQSAKSALEKVDQVTTQLNAQEGTLGKLINDKALYNDLSGTVQSVKDLVAAIQKNPKRYLDVDVYLIERKKKNGREVEALRQEVDALKAERE